MTLFTPGASRGPQYALDLFTERAEGAVFVPSTARSQLEGKFMDDRPTFEETYPRYEFSELVRVGIALATWTVRMLRRTKAHRPDALPTPAAENELRAN